MNKWLNNVEQSAVDVIAVFAPWLGPIPSAYLVGVAVYEHLQWHWLVALIAAIAVESIGVVSVVVALRLHEWNATRRKIDPAAPFTLSLITVIVYFIITIGLTVLLDVFPELAIYAPAIFPLLAAVGAVNIAVKNGQQRREDVRAQPKKQRKLPKVTSQVAETSQPETLVTFTDYRKIPDAVKLQMADMSPVEIQKTYGAKERTAQNWARNAR
ncbi:MAG: hypothetical protein GY938_31315, partial [Ketobacter sp.]|nr:hypothetical protein [Ketobacter sp.]